MADFTINFFVPISIDRTLNTPLFYMKESKDKTGTESKEQDEAERKRVEEIEEFNERTGIIELGEFIKNFNQATGLKWELWDVNDRLSLEYPYKIEYREPTIFTTVEPPESILSPADCNQCTLVKEEVRIFLHSFAVAIVNYTAKFTSELPLPAKEAKDIYEVIVSKFKHFKEYIPDLAEHAENVKDKVIKHIDSHKMWAFYVDAGYALSKLFPWQYVVFHMHGDNKKSKLSDEQITELIYDDEDIKDYSKDKSRQIYIAWKAALIVSEEPHRILPHDYLAEISCCLWRELQLVENLLNTQARQLLLQARRKPTARHLETIRHIRVVAETVLSKARSFHLHFQIEYIGFVEAICKKWLITDNLTVSIKNRAATVDMIYDNAKDAMNDRRHTWLGYITLIFTTLSFIAVVTALASFWDYQDKFIKLDQRTWLLIVMGIIAAGAIVGFWRWLRR